MFSPTLSKVLQNCLFDDLWYLVVLFKLLCLLSCVFYSKSFQEGEKKDEWKSDNGFVGNKTETFPQLHHLPPWLYLYPTTSFLSSIHFFHKSIIYPLTLSLSHNSGAFFVWPALILNWPRIMCSRVRMLKFLELSREML